MRCLTVFLVVLASSQVPASGPAVRFAVIADQQGGAMPGVYDSVLAEVARMDPDFIVTVGDQVEGYLGPDTAALRKQFDGVFAQYDRAFGPRWRNDEYLVLCPGNHDVTTDEAEPLWRELVGPVCRRVDVCGVSVFVIDNSRHEQADGVPAEQFAFLDRELATIPNDRPVIVVLHKPYFNEFVWRGRDDPAHRLFVEHGVDAVLGGHWHDYVYDARDGVQYVVCGSSGGGTNGQGLANGEFVGFIWGTVRGGGVTLTPVSLGSIHDRDLVSVAENDAFFQFTSSGLTMTPFPIGGSPGEYAMSPTSEGEVFGTVTVTARNFGDRANTDTLAWTVPSNWRVSSQRVPFDAAAGDSTVATFELAYSGQVFPIPTLSTGLSYGRGKRATTSAALRLDRRARCPKVRRIAFDGVIGDEWSGAHAETMFMSPDGQPAATDPTTFFFAHDDKGLYLGAVCVASPDHPIVADVVERDGAVHREDCVGWFLSPAPDAVYQIYVNPNGTLFDGKGSVVEGEVFMDYGYDGDFTVVAAKGAGSWSVEIFVPFREIGVRRWREATDLRVNVRRKQRALSTSADWLPVEFNPATMGRLELGR